MRNPRAYCPNPDCEHWRDPYAKPTLPPPPIDFYRKDGYRRPKHNHQPVPVYECKSCGKKFSATLVKPIRNQKRPDLNRKIFALAVSGATMRRISILLGCDRTQSCARSSIWQGKPRSTTPKPWPNWPRKAAPRM